nr:transaldolase [Tanacetum cinerariifolium]
RIVRLVYVHREHLPKLACARKAGAKAEDVAGNVVHRSAFIQVRFNVGPHKRQRSGTADLRRGVAKQLAINISQQIRVVIRLAAEHHAVKGVQVFLALLQRLDATVEDNFQLGKVMLELGGDIIAQRRDVTVFLGRQTLKDGDAGVHGEAGATGIADGADELAQLLVTVASIDADAVLHRHRNRHRVAHGLDAVGDQLRMPHQHRADHVVLHPIAGAADVEVHLVVARRLRQACAGSQVSRVAAAQLQRQRMLRLVVAQEPLGVTVQQRAGGDHLGIEQRERPDTGSHQAPAALTLQYRMTVRQSSAQGTSAIDQQGDLQSGASKPVCLLRFTPLSGRRRSGNVSKPTGQSTLMTSKLEQLKQFTTVVADTGDFAAIEKLKPVDATTNPSLLLKAASSDSNSDRLKEAFAGSNNDINVASDRFAVAIGREILKVVPGRAQACADAGVFLISPFVGRIYDWYKKAEGKEYVGAEDPGVQSVTRIYNYYKANDYKTVVMGASFRNLSQIEELAGCDRLTISPDLLHKLSEDDGTLVQKLKPGNGGEARVTLNESQFRWASNEDAMATEKLAEGIRQFARDQVALEKMLSNKA